jgi:hypothetical protein
MSSGRPDRPSGQNGGLRLTPLGVDESASPSGGPESEDSAAIAHRRLPIGYGMRPDESAAMSDEHPMRPTDAFARLGRINLGETDLHGVLQLVADLAKSTVPAPPRCR